MHALHQHVGGDEHLLVGIIQHRAIIAHAFQRRGVLGLQVFSEPVDETEFSKFLYLHLLIATFNHLTEDLGHVRL